MANGSFVKLKNKIEIDISKIIIKNEMINYGYDIDGQFKGISYCVVEGDVISQVMNVIPERYRKNFAVAYMRINNSIPAHTDNRILSSLNFYIKPSNCVTQFYKVKPGNVVKYKHPSTTPNYVAENGLAFKEQDLDTTESFIAETNDVWLLDVTKPHAVKALSEPTDRVAITLSSLIYDYNLVCKMLAETGNL
jgi:hypothetical protein